MEHVHTGKASTNDYCVERLVHLRLRSIKLSRAFLMHSLLHPLYLYGHKFSGDFQKPFRYFVYYGMDVQVLKSSFCIQMEVSLALIGNGFISI